MALSFLKIFQNFSKIQWFLIALSGLYFIKVLVSGPGDFAVYWGASKALSHSQMIYHQPFIVNPDSNEWCEYSYSPFFAFILIPLSLLPIKLANVIWLAFNLAALFRTFDLLVAFLGIKDVFSEKEYRWWVFGTLLFSVRFILDNFDLSQITPILLCCSLEALRLAHQKRWLLSGLILATITIIKLMPLVLLPYFFWRRYWQAGLVTIGFMILFLFIPSVFYVWQDYKAMLQDWVGVLNPSSDDFTIQENLIEESIHSLSSFIPAFFTDDITRYDTPRHFVDLSKASMLKLLTITRLFFIGLTLIFIGIRPFVKINDKKQLLWEFSYLMIAIALIFPHQQKYAFVLILPACGFVLYSLMMMKKTGFNLNHKGYYSSIIALMVVVWLLTTASTDGIIGRPLYAYAQYFKLITWGTMLLIVPLYIQKFWIFDAKPKRTE